MSENSDRARRNTIIIDKIVVIGGCGNNQNKITIKSYGIIADSIFPIKKNSKKFVKKVIC